MLVNRCELPPPTFESWWREFFLFVYFYLSREAGYFKSYLPFSKISFNEGFESLPGFIRGVRSIAYMFGTGHAITNIWD